MSDPNAPQPASPQGQPHPRPDAAETAAEQPTVSFPVQRPDAVQRPDQGGPSGPVTATYPTFAPPHAGYGYPVAPTRPHFPAGPPPTPYPSAPGGAGGPDPAGSPYAPATGVFPSAGGPSASAGGPFASAGGPDVPGEVPPTARKERSRPGWFGVIAVAAAAALGASLATAGLTGAFAPGGPSAVFEAIGRPEITIPVSGSTADNPDWQVVAAAVRDSVVAITVTTPSGQGQGSGVIVSAEGHVVTNEHVISDGANGVINVTLADGRLFEATIVGMDPTTDIAVIQLQNPPDDLATATLGDSDDVVVGAAVMAVGNPLGLDSTVTTGIVSAVDRPVTTQEAGSGPRVVTNAIQVDAAINPGNSGGPLFNSSGEVIGITSSIATLSSSARGGSIGLGFAIPVNQATFIANQLIESGTAEHAFLGVTLSDGSATVEGTTRRGAVVESVTPGTPAEGAGLRQGDVVVAIDGRAVAGAESLTGFVRQHASGDEVTLTIVRDGAASSVTATLTTRPVEEAADQSEGGSESPFGR